VNVIKAIHGRRSVRAYRPEPVDRALIEDLIFDAAQVPAPPVSGESPFAFCIVEGADRLAAYGERAKQYAQDHQPAGHPWSWCERPDFKVFWDAPVLVLICARSTNPEAPFDCCRAGQNLMLAAHARGLGTCWVGAPMPWLHSAGVAAELGLPPDLDPAVAMILGYAAGVPESHPRPRPAIVWC
jgi:nitroreductase